jgi:hemerythrin-like domain-containing protein
MQRDPVDTSDPFAMLLRCHRRLEERLAELEGAAGLDRDEARAVAGEVLGFLDRAVARHEADEEQSLFPRLTFEPKLAPLLERLAREHAEQARVVERLRGALENDALDPPALTALARELRGAYDRHVAVEESELFPAARALLGPDSLDDIAREMEERRGAGGGGHRHRGRR